MRTFRDTPEHCEGKMIIESETDEYINYKCLKCGLYATMHKIIVHNEKGFNSDERVK